MFGLAIMADQQGQAARAAFLAVLGFVLYRALK
jgi:hypothetical protein